MYCSKHIEREDEMFKNVGSKVKTLAVIYFALATILSIIVGFILLFSDMILLGIGLLLLGPLSAYLLALPMITLGEVHESNRRILGYVSNDAGNQEENAPNKESTEVKPSANITAANLADATAGGSWQCTCGRKNQAYVSSCICGINKRELSIKK